MSEDFDGRLRQLLRHTASVLDEQDTHNLLVVRPKQEPSMRLRPIAVAAIAVAVLAVTFGVFRTLRPSPSPTAAASSSPAAVAPLSCPSTVPVKKAPPAQQQDLVKGDPTSGLLCVYGPLPEQRLTGSKAIPTARLGDLRTRLNSLPAFPAVTSCPNDDGSAYVVALRGASGDQTIVIKRTGCGEVNDGREVRKRTSELMATLTDLAG